MRATDRARVAHRRVAQSLCALLLAAFAITPMGIAAPLQTTDVAANASTTGGNTTDVSPATPPAPTPTGSPESSTDPKPPETPGRGTTDAGEGFGLSAMGKAVFAAFVLAVVLESALALIFNWRPFVRTFDGRGVKSVIALAVSLVVVRATDLDLVSVFGNAMDGPPKPGAQVGESWPGSLITAFVVAGGSGGVNRLLVALGFRAVARTDEVTPKPPPQKAWLAVRIDRTDKTSADPILVLLAEGTGPLRLIGTIHGRQPPERIWRWALQDRTRFPTVGGYAVPGDIAYTLELHDKANAPIPLARWGPIEVAKGAAIDVEMTV